MATYGRPIDPAKIPPDARTSRAAEDLTELEAKLGRLSERSNAEGKELALPVYPESTRVRSLALRIRQMLDGRPYTVVERREAVYIIQERLDARA